MCAFGAEILDYIEKVAGGTGEAIKPNDYKCVAGGNLAEEFREGRAGARGTGTMLAYDGVAADSSQLDFLRFGGLFVGRNASAPRVTSNSSGCGQSNSSTPRGRT